ncbi:MAG TPA: four helix bundle protein [Chitinophagaceae bacterium]|nr:four helix bundle protein [Chitinophagaceae bacterium]
MKNFKELKIWQKAFEITINGFMVTRGFPAEQKFVLTSQITRAAISIPSNIAEGNSRTSDKDKNRFIEIALGSCFEMETQLLITQKLGFGDPRLISSTLNLLIEEEKMLSSFSKTLKADND